MSTLQGEITDNLIPLHLPRSMMNKSIPKSRATFTSATSHDFPYASPFTSTFAFAYKAFPCADFPFTGTNPMMFKALRADRRASLHFFRAEAAHNLFARADFFLDTTLPLLFLMSPSFVTPPEVFSLRPRKTSDLAITPRATPC